MGISPLASFLAASMNQRIFVLGLGAVAVVALLAGGGWYQARQEAKEARAQLVAVTLEPAEGLLKENAALINELQSDGFTEKNAGILESYLLKLRRDGVAPNAVMKQKLDALAENTTEIATLLAAYAPRAKTAVFAAEAKKFNSYAAAWRDRWNSVIELFMAGGDFPASSVSYPAALRAAVEKEIEVNR